MLDGVSNLKLGREERSAAGVGGVGFGLFMDIETDRKERPPVCVAIHQKDLHPTPVSTRGKMERSEASHNAEPHALDLKVMRISRPRLAATQTPYVESKSVDSSAIGTTFRASLVETDKQNSTLLRNLLPQSNTDGTSVLDDIPLSAVLLLPEAVGTISLGESFRSIITLSNDSASPVRAPRIIAEIQTNTRKVEVTRMEGTHGVLEKDAHLETIVEWEMQELGMTVLSVTVSYETSAGPREFTRYYKFNVTAPLAIKTKTHLPSAVNALFSPTVRERVYLEVVIQNIINTPIAFTSINFLPVPGITVVEAPPSTSYQVEDDERKSTLLSTFEGPAELLQPGNTRQLLYVLAPAPRPEFPKSSLFLPHFTPGQMLPLGKLDLSWNGPYGESGHLMTSVLGRRAPPVSPVLSLRLPRTETVADERPPLEVDVTILGWDKERIRMGEHATMNLRLALRSPTPITDENKMIYIGYQWLVIKKVKPPPKAETPMVNVSVPLEPTPSRSLLSQAQRFPHLLPSRLSRPATPITPATAPGTPVSTPLSRQTSNASEASAKPVPHPSAPSPFPPRPYLDVIDDERERQPFDGYIEFSGTSLEVTQVELKDLETTPIVRDESPRTSIDGSQVLPPPPPAKTKQQPEGFVDFGILLMPMHRGLGYIEGLRILQIYDRKDLVKGGGRTLAEFPTLGEVWIEGS
ncbi:hypothetical protein QFC21_005965 [Naganishia friedmannii]|uniref:Uncharacterized protein n=1 Tax=Naganishia friedmannii TaxID=89922 RepID=A0ACC2V6E5_9TREE|nr:hypothetical protein QFC21_005965 [Naganishia friedmannii]